MVSDALSIKEILNYLLTTHGMSEAELGRKINVPRPTINRLVSGRTPDPRASTLKAIADYFEVSIDQLLGKQPLLINNCQNLFKTTNIELPIIDWTKATKWEVQIQNLNHENHFDWVMIDPSIETGLFALKVQGESMWPQFAENTVLIIDPKKQAKNKDFVIVYIKQSDEIFFRQLIIEGKYKFLKAINVIFPTISIGSDDIIIGVVLQARNDYQ